MRWFDTRFDPLSVCYSCVLNIYFKQTPEIDSNYSHPCFVNNSALLHLSHHLSLADHRTSTDEAIVLVPCESGSYPRVSSATCKYGSQPFIVQLEPGDAHIYSVSVEKDYVSKSFSVCDSLSTRPYSNNKTSRRCCYLPMPMLIM